MILCEINFDAAKDGGSIKKQLTNVPGVKVILDTTWIDSSQLQNLRVWLNNNISPSELSRIVEVNSNLL